MIKKHVKNSLSVFGNPPKTCYVHAENLKNKFGKNYKVLVPDAIDGQTALVFAGNGNNVDCYETNDILLNGGEIDTFKTIGLYKKVQNERLEDKVNIYNTNFYENKVIDKYDFVYCYRSLHIEKNNSIEMGKKIKKSMTAVKEGGYLYIYYYMPMITSDYESYPSNSYLRSYEVKSYFDSNV